MRLKKAITMEYLIILMLMILLGIFLWYIIRRIGLNVG